MGKTKENPRYNVISVRVSDDELKEIKGVLTSGEAISDLLRDGALFCAKMRQAPATVTTRTIRSGK